MVVYSKVPKVALEVHKMCSIFVMIAFVTVCVSMLWYTPMIIPPE